MRKTTLIIALLFLSLFTFGQEHEEANLIDLDSTWGKEVFKFPIRFAQNIDYKGFAEVRFPPKGWRDVHHKNFWSYTYAWNINLNKKVTAKELAANLIKYFDGLNGVDAKDKTNKQKAFATIIKVKGNKKKLCFKGKVDTYDHFATNKRIILNVLIESNYCKKTKRTVILFKFSPKDFNHKTWKMLEKIKLRSKKCE